MDNLKKILNFFEIGNFILQKILTNEKHISRILVVSHICGHTKRFYHGFECIVLLLFPTTPMFENVRNKKT